MNTLGSHHFTECLRILEFIECSLKNISQRQGWWFASELGVLLGFSAHWFQRCPRNSNKRTKEKSSRPSAVLWLCVISGPYLSSRCALLVLQKQALDPNVLFFPVGARCGCCRSRWTRPARHSHLSPALHNIEIQKKHISLFFCPFLFSNTIETQQLPFIWWENF